MATSTELFEKWLAGRENEHLEFKKAETRFAFSELGGHPLGSDGANLGQGQAIIACDLRRRFALRTV